MKTEQVSEAEVRRYGWELDNPPAENGIDAVLVVDMSEKFLKEISKYSVSQQIMCTRRLLEVCAENGILLVGIEYEGKGRTVPKLKEVIDAAPEHYFLTKEHDDAFEETELADKLRESGATHLCVTGVQAFACVKKTIMGAMQKGFRVSTARQLINSYCGISHSEREFLVNVDYHTDYRMLLPMISKSASHEQEH